MAFAIGINFKAFDEAGQVLFVRFCQNKQAVRRVLLHDNPSVKPIAYIEYRGKRWTMDEVYSKFPLGFFVKPIKPRADIDG